ncbi:hypothetical protein CYMTET_4860 [Cymbomonas tetramitiformis]|uniref:Uncharacterized protein n=1 Tax=Cymbomonas tetramitiformis TaxID=36881 RepID=A0AAE0H0J7_9CHLO|nr:hypothetical protein CYMTET_4860 [Cymbomonas tetramitiformis]
MPPKSRKQNPEARHKLTAADWEDLQGRGLTGDDRLKAIREYKKKYRKSAVDKVTRQQWIKQGKLPSKEEKRLAEIEKYTVADSKRHIKLYNTDVERLKVPFATFLTKEGANGSSLNYWLPKKSKAIEQIAMRAMFEDGTSSKWVKGSNREEVMMRFEEMLQSPKGEESSKKAVEVVKDIEVEYYASKPPEGKGSRCTSAPKTINELRLKQCVIKIESRNNCGIKSLELLDRKRKLDKMLSQGVIFKNQYENKWKQLKRDASGDKGNITSASNKLRFELFPEKHNAEGKLTFPLYEMVGTWTTVELNKAVEKGYTIIDIYEVKHWKETTIDLFATYIDMFLKLKTEASGPPDKEVDEFVKEFEFHEGVKLDKTNIKYNPGLRQVSKDMQNILYGKLGERQNKAKSKIIQNPGEFYNTISNKRYHCKYEFVGGENGPKSYSLKFADGYAMTKIKGFSLSVDNLQHVNHDVMKDMIIGRKHEKEKSVNKGYAVILTAVNINTNKAYAIALKSKTVRDKADKRKEDVEGKSNWVDYIDTIVDNYNETGNQGNVNDTPPDSMNKNRVIRTVLLKRNETAKLLQKLDIKPGDNVRLRVTKKIFDKEKRQWSTKVYKVKSRKGLAFVIEDGNGDTLSRKYKPRELLEVQGPVSKSSKETRGTKTDADSKASAKAERQIKKEGLEANTESKTSRNYDGYEVNVFISDKKSPNYQKTLKGYLKLNKTKKSKRKYELIFYDKTESPEFVDIPDPEITLLKKRNNSVPK